MTKIATPAVVVSFFAMLSFSGCSFFGAFGAEWWRVSDLHPTYLTSDGPTYIIWGVIYAWLGVSVLVQCATTIGSATEELLSRVDPLTGLDVRWRLVISFSFTAVWQPLFATAHFAVALVVIVPHLIVLISLYSDLHVRRATISVWLQFGAPVSITISWTVVTLCQQIFVVAGEYGWKDGYGVCGTAHAAVVVVVSVTALSGVIGFAFYDPAWPAVVVWAFGGVLRTQMGAVADYPFAARDDTLYLTSLIVVIVGCVATVGSFGFFCYWHSQPRPSPCPPYPPQPPYGPYSPCPPQPPYGPYYGQLMTKP